MHAGHRPGFRLHTAAGLKPRLHMAIAALSLAAAVGAASCASSGARPQPFPSPPAADGVPAKAPSDPATTPDAFSCAHAPMRPCAHDGYAIASAALRLQGVPYRSGGSDLRGFDCSGLVQYVLAQYGLAVPRVVRDQYDVGSRVHLDELEPGDLVFFTTEGRARVSRRHRHRRRSLRPRTECARHRARRQSGVGLLGRTGRGRPTDRLMPKLKLGPTYRPSRVKRRPRARGARRSASERAARGEGRARQAAR